jgi:hypothetical protein
VNTNYLAFDIIFEKMYTLRMKMIIIDILEEICRRVSEIRGLHKGYMKLLMDMDRSSIFLN